MFGFRRRGTVIDQGLKIVGNVTADGLVEVRGRIEGDLECSSLVIAKTASILGSVAAEHIVVDGRVEGPVIGRDVCLKSGAHVVGDVQHDILRIESGAHFDGRSLTNGHNANDASKVEQLEPAPARMNARVAAAE